MDKDKDRIVGGGGGYRYERLFLVRVKEEEGVFDEGFQGDGDHLSVSGNEVVVDVDDFFNDWIVVEFILFGEDIIDELL